MSVEGLWIHNPKSATKVRHLADLGRFSSALVRHGVDHIRYRTLCGRGEPVFPLGRMLPGTILDDDAIAIHRPCARCVELLRRRIAYLQRVLADTETDAA